ncbi:MAG: hypothetical protein IID16_03580 [Candidatus Marinimicrobia bacterium]|nr:hypothetical protein [Candidatus Neomarinimicrobiota bacterium]
MRFLLIRNWLSVSYLLFNFLYLNPLQGQTLEEILASIQIEEDGDLLTDDELLILEEMVQRPLDLNRATRNDLEIIPLLAAEETSLILHARKRLGSFSSMEQITSIPGLSSLTVLLLPMITTVKFFPPLKMKLRSRWVSSGEDVRMLTQATFTQSSISGGFLLERDPNEPSLGDYVSAFFSTTRKNNTRIIFGDYQIIHGYGLLFGRSARTIKGQSSISRLTKPGKRIKPYRSAMEYWTLRGMAVEHTNSIGRWLFSLSFSPKDATLDSNRVISFATSGLHQTENSLSRKHNLREDLAIVSWGKEINDVGEIGVLIARDRLIVNGVSPVNRDPKSYGSIYGRTMLSNLTLFGEVASYTGGKPSAIGGYVLTENNLRWVATVRYYTQGFQGPRSQPFREWSSHKLNEIGFYQALSIKMGRHRVQTYGDIYRQNASANPSVKPIKGYETVAIWSYKWQKDPITFRWKREEKTVENDITYVKTLLDEVLSRNSFRFQLVRTLSSHFRFQLQGDYTYISEGDSTDFGYGLSTKILYYGKQYHFSANWVGFVVDDFKSRIYVWDVNLPGELRSKAFFPTGQSVALLFRVKTITNATISARIRSTWEFSRYTGKWYKSDVVGGFQMDIAL